MKLGRLCAFFLFLFWAACGKQVPPNLSGEWHPSAGPGEAMTIDHKEPEVKIKSGLSVYSYTTDGSETCNVVDGEMVCSKGRWDGPFLQIDSTIKRAAGEIASSERWSLAPNGRDLSIQRTAAGGARTVVSYQRR